MSDAKKSETVFEESSVLVGKSRVLSGTSTGKMLYYARVSHI